MTTTQSRNPSCVWVCPRDIGGRLDASYFHHQYLSLDSSLAQFSKREVVPLDACLEGPRRVLYQKTTSYSADEAPEGAVPFISGVDLDGATMTVNWSSVRYVDRWMLQKYPKGQLTDGSLLIKVKGPNQHTAFVSNVDRTALVSGTVFFAGVVGCNPFYIAAYLSSRQGTAWRSRLRTNTTVEFIGNDELRAVPVPLPDSRIQGYIGAKVELAERCRAVSSQRWEAATEHLGDALGFPLTTETFEIRSTEAVSAGGYHVMSIRPVAALVSAERLNGAVGAQFFTPRRAKAILVIEQSGLQAKRLTELADRFAKRIRSDDVQKNGLPYVGLAQIDSTTGFVASTGDEQPTGSSASFGARDILFSKLRPYLNKVAICPEHLDKAVGSTELVTYRARPDVDPYYVFFVLKSPLVLNQVIDITSGSTHPRVDPDLIDDVLVPMAPESTRKLIGSAARDSLQLLRQASLLVDAAKADVEALIDGTLDVDAILAGTLKAPTAEDIPELAEDDA